MKKKIVILGSTGSIGVNTLDVVSKMPEEFEVLGLSADSNWKLLSRQAGVFRPRMVSIGSEKLAKKLKSSVPSGTKVVFGVDGLRQLVSIGDAQIVVFASSGTSCLIPLVEAIKNRKRIALANKEALVSAGRMIMGLARANGVSIIPVDSEHSAIFQCISGRTDSVSRIYLTGSGGPLLNVARGKFDSLPRKFILNHPRWKMGKKITVDSATMMNKGLEIIEAMYLFNLSEDRIKTLVHPEAIVHSMVEFDDAAVLAQMAAPDMRLPIQYALTYPRRSKAIAPKVDFSGLGKLTFLEPDTKKFPCLELARAAAREDALAPAVLNAADEEAVAAYLGGEIRFSAIPKVVEKVLAKYKRPKGGIAALEEILASDQWAREEAKSICSRL